MSFLDDLGGFAQNVGKTALGGVTGGAAGFLTGGIPGFYAGATAGTVNGLVNWNKGSYDPGEAAKSGTIFGGASGFAAGVFKTAAPTAFKNLTTVPSVIKDKGIGGALTTALSSSKLTVPAALKSAGIAGLVTTGVQSLLKKPVALPDAGGVVERAGQGLQIFNVPAPAPMETGAAMQPAVTSSIPWIPLLIVAGGAYFLFGGAKAPATKTA